MNKDKSLQEIRKRLALGTSLLNDLRKPTSMEDPFDPVGHSMDVFVGLKKPLWIKPDVFVRTRKLTLESTRHGGAPTCY